MERSNKWLECGPIMERMVETEGFTCSRATWDGEKQCFRLTFLMSNPEVNRRKLSGEYVDKLLDEMRPSCRLLDAQRREYGLRVRFVV